MERHYSYESIGDMFEDSRWVYAARNGFKGYPPALITYNEFTALNEKVKSFAKSSNAFMPSGSEKVKIAEIKQGTSFIMDEIILDNGKKGTMLQFLNAIINGYIYITNPSMLKDWYGFNIHPYENFTGDPDFRTRVCDYFNRDDPCGDGLYPWSLGAGAEDLVRHGGFYTARYCDNGNSMIVILDDFYWGILEPYEKGDSRRRFILKGKIENEEQVKSIIKQFNSKKYDGLINFIAEEDARTAEYWAKRREEDIKRQEEDARIRAESHQKYGSKENYLKVVEWAKHKGRAHLPSFGDYDEEYEVHVTVVDSQDRVVVVGADGGSTPVYTVEEGEAVFDRYEEEMRHRHGWNI